MIKHKLVTMPIKDLKPAAFNPRKISPTAQKALATSIKRFGLVQPIIYNKKTGNVVGGHQRLDILKANKETSVDVIEVELSAADEKALNIALNNIGGEWDYDKLQDILQDLGKQHYKMDVLGFTAEELSSLITDSDELNKQMTGPGLTPEERLVIFNANTIKQIVLFFPTEQYAPVLLKIKQIMEEQKLPTNSDVFVHLLKLYENTPRKTQTSGLEKADIARSVAKGLQDIRRRTSKGVRRQSA